MLFSSQTSVAIRRLGSVPGVEMLMDAGYPALDYSYFQVKNPETVPDEGEFREIRALVDSRGVIFNQAHAPFGGGRERYTTELLPLMPAVFKLSGILGVRQIVVHPIQDGPYYHHEKELFDLNVEFYKSFAPLAKENGLKVAIENMWQRHPVSGHIRDDILANPQELVDMFDALDDPDAFTVCLDIGHVALCGREPEDAIRTIGHDRLDALHVHDVDYISDLHTLPGFGKIDWDSVTTALGDIDYKGELTLEADNFFARTPDALLPETARYMAIRAKYLADQVDAARKK